MESQIADGRIHNSVNLINGPNHEVWITEESSSLFSGSTNNGAGGGAQIARVDAAGNVTGQIDLPPAMSVPVISAIDAAGFVWVSNFPKTGALAANAPDFVEIDAGGHVCRSSGGLAAGAPVWVVPRGGVLYFTAQGAADGLDHPTVSVIGKLTG